MIQLAISSWTLHGALGQVWYAPTAAGNMENQNDNHATTLSLLELPAFAAKDGIDILEICHFHFPSTDDDYLAQLKDALDSADVKLANVLIDTGNLSNPDETQWRTDIEMTKGWQDVAVRLGANGVRIDCGLEPATSESIKRSADALRELADYGTSIGLTTTTENWRTTSVYTHDLLDIMQQVDRPLKLCVDFGNAEKTDDKYTTMAQLLPQATSLHCKGHFDGDTLDVDEFEKCLSLVKEANFGGHIALIYGGVDNEWDKVLTLKQHVERQLL
jgi:sugar phosphate isomerase/epimerase